MFDQNESIILTKDLLIALGMEIQKDTHVLVDQETKSQIAFEQKFIVASTDPNEYVSVRDCDIRLEPLNPKCTRMLEQLFGKFLDDSAEMENLPGTTVFYFDKDEETHKYRLTIKFDDGNMWCGNWYFNKIICFDEAIFSLDGTFSDKDLRPYDIEPEDNNE